MSPRQDRRPIKMGLIALLFGVSLTLLASQSNPTQYTVSAYASVPWIFWAGALVPAVVGMALVFSPHHNSRAVGFLSVSASMLTIVLLPILDGFWFYGANDPMTHLAISHAIRGGQMSPTDFFYPALHLTANTISTVTNISLRTTHMGLVGLFAALYLCFLPLLVRWVWETPSATASAAALAALLLPNAAVVMPVLRTTPFMLGVFYLPFAIYVGMRQVHGRKRWMFISLPAFATGILIHPIIAASLTAIFGISAGVSRWTRSETPATPRHEHLALLISIGAFYWAFSFTNKLGYIVGLWAARYSGLGGDLAQTSSSLQQIGVGLPELFLKIFALKAAVLVIAAGFGVVLIGRAISSRTSESENVFLQIGLGVLPLVAVMLAFAFAGNPNQYSRYLSVIVVVGSLFAAVVVGKFIDGRPSSTVRRRTIQTLFIAALLISIPVLHPSPWIVRPSTEVTPQHAAGFQTLMQYESPEAVYLSAGTDVDSFRFAISNIQGRGIDSPEYAPNSVMIGERPPTHFADLSEHYEHPYYLPISDYEVRTHTELYDGVVYTRADFNRLGQSHSVVYSNGEQTIYHGDGAG